MRSVKFLIKKNFWKRLGRAFVEATNDGCLGCAKGAAYSALLSIFPALSTLAAVLSQVKAEAVSEKIAELLFGVAPPGTEDLLQFAITVRGQRPAYLLIGAILLSAIGASGVVLSLVDGFQFAYRVRNRRNFWRQRGIAMLLVFVMATPALCAAALIVYFKSALIYIPAVFAVAVSTLLLYRFGPDLPPDLRRAPIWPGAIVATFVWMLATVLFVWYLRNLANYNVVYGSIGAVIALLVWLYLLAASTLIGCEYNAERMREDLRPA